MNAFLTVICFKTIIILYREDKDGIKKRKRQKDDPIIHVFKTKSVEKDSLDDGYKWRKYGKKPIRGSPFPR